MYKFRKKRNTIPMVFLFFCGFLSEAQEPEEKPPENNIFCAEIDIEVDGFEVLDPSIIIICCGDLFQEVDAPCKVLTRKNYEAFSGQSYNSYNPVNEGFLITDLLEPIKNKLSKLKEIKVTVSDEVFLQNKMKIAIRKGIYTIKEGMIYLEVEYIK